MKKRNLLIVGLTAILVMACSFGIVSPQRVQGSGVAAREERSVSGFSAVEIAGSADVTIHFGDTESVVVETDDNVMPLITTVVRGGRLVINTRNNTNITTQIGIDVTVTMKSLEEAVISGSGNMTIAGLQGGSLKVSLPGSGNITASGAADELDLTLGGSGNILCGDLQAKSATVRLEGSGNITVYASESLNARIGGSGNIQYGGNPPQLQKNVSGSGSIDPMP